MKRGKRDQVLLTAKGIKREHSVAVLANRNGTGRKGRLDSVVPLQLHLVVIIPDGVTGDRRVVAHLLRAQELYDRTRRYPSNR